MLTKGLGYLSQGPYGIDIYISDICPGVCCSQWRPNQQSQWCLGEILHPEREGPLLAKMSGVLRWLTLTLLWLQRETEVSCLAANAYILKTHLDESHPRVSIHLLSCSTEMTSNDHSQVHSG